MKKSIVCTTALPLVLLASAAHTEEGLLLIEEENTEQELLLIDEESNESTEGNDSLLLIEEATEDTSLSIEPDNTPDSKTTRPAGQPKLHSQTNENNRASSLTVDNLWAEYGHFYNADSTTEHLGYLHGKTSYNWSNEQWEIKASARIDGYSERGDNDFDRIEADYDELYLRYKSSDAILTIGAQKVIWGRIDEFPPTDQLSTQDFRRFIVDDLEERRLASPAIRYEHFFETAKVDLLYYPKFREAQLPDQESLWFPVNRRTGEILGFETTEAIEALVTNTPIDENPPESEGGFGIRYSSLGSDIDYGITLQRGRSTVPYFAFNPDSNTIEGRYPRNWVIGGDAAFEALGGTLKFEGSWLSDIPVTRSNGIFTTTKGVQWGAALEIFPGDGDARLNLQLIGRNLIGNPSTLDRDNTYTFNGSYEIPFGNDNWRSTTRFNIGLDEQDYYFNPEIAYTGFESQEIYLELHYFDGDLGSLGGFYQDNSALTLGWKANF